MDTDFGYAVNQEGEAAVDRSRELVPLDIERERLIVSQAINRSAERPAA